MTIRKIAKNNNKKCSTIGRLTIRTAEYGQWWKWWVWSTDVCHSPYPESSSLTVKFTTFLLVPLLLFFFNGIFEFYKLWRTREKRRIIQNKMKNNGKNWKNYKKILFLRNLNTKIKQSNLFNKNFISSLLHF